MRAILEHRTSYCKQEQFRASTCQRDEPLITRPLIPRKRAGINKADFNRRTTTMEQIRRYEEGELQETQRALALPPEESHDERAIRLGIGQALADGRPIDDYTARYIASQLHGGQVSALYSLASTGNIDPAVFAELEADRETFEPQVQGWVDALHSYCQDRPDKGPIEGWLRRAAEQERPDNEPPAGRDLVDRSSVARMTAHGQAAIVRGSAPDDRGDPGSDEADHFSWDDAFNWNPAEAAAGQVQERRCSPEELDELSASSQSSRSARSMSLAGMAWSDMPVGPVGWSSARMPKASGTSVKL